MIDIKLVRESPEVVKASQVARQTDPGLVDELLKLDQLKRAARQTYDELRAKQGKIGKEIASKTGDEKAQLLQEVASLAKEVKVADEEVGRTESEFDFVASQIQNVIEDAPSGGEEDFVIIKEIGDVNTAKTMGFEPKAHWQLGEDLDIIDTKRGSKVAGSRFYFLKGLGARLDLALPQMALSLALKNGFIPMITPTLVRPEVMRGTGFLGLHDAEVYRLGGDDDSYLVGTSEVALAGYHQDEFLEFPVVDSKRQPIKYSGYSSCYRREAGAAGKDTRGIIRVHQFNKLEMFVYCTQEQAKDEHLKLLSLEEQMIQALELPYRVIDTAAGDLGSSAARKFDCEAWLPSENRYLELTSTSNCTTYQARRLNVREKTEAGTQNVATLNGTLATTRFIVAILENHQQADGSIKVPKALQPFLGVEVIGR
ncbi:serine--tRNA ligase [Actinomycetota bacterium]|nr:serine--tRNA ligase [Actinomycetota bacterium]